MPPNTQPTPAAISAALREVRRQTRNSSWRYSGGRWVSTRVDANGRPRDYTANAVETARFNAILAYFAGLYPQPLPPAPPPPPIPPSLRQRLFGQNAGAGGGFNPLGSLRASVASRGIVGAGLGLGAGAIGGAAGIGSALVGGIGTILKSALSLIGGALKIGLGVITTALAIGATALFAFTRIVSNVTKDMIRVSREITTIRNNTGRDIGSAQRGYYALRAGGLSGASASALLSGDQMRGNQGRQLAGAFNLPDPTSVGFLSAAARKFQGMNIYQGRAMADTLSGGSASPEFLQALNTRPEVIERQQKQQQADQRSLGVTPEMIRRLSDEYPLLQNRMSNFTEMAKMRFIGVMLPAMTRGLEWTASQAEKNGPKIAAAIQSGVRWLWVDGISLIFKGARFGLNAIEMLTNGIFSLGDGIVAGLRSFQAGESSIYNFFMAIARGVDFLTRGVGDFATGVGYVGALLNNLRMVDPIDMAARGLMGLPARQYQDPIQTALNAGNRFKPTNFAADFEAFRKSGASGRFADGLESQLSAARDTTGRGLRGARAGVDEAEAFFGTDAQRGASFDANIKELVGAVRNMDKNNTDRLDGLKREVERNGGIDVIGSLKSSIARDAYTVGF